MMFDVDRWRVVIYGLYDLLYGHGDDESLVQSTYMYLPTGKQERTCLQCGLQDTGVKDAGLDTWT
jgi:hypothetical protein